MRDYFSRLAAVNSVVAALCFAAAYYVEITALMLFAGLVALFSLRFMLGKDKAERMRIWNMRRKVFARDKRLKWLAIFVNFVLPIWAGAAAYALLDYSQYNALAWFMGATHLGALFMNWLMLPRLERVIGSVFD